MKSKLSRILGALIPRRNARGASQEYLSAPPLFDFENLLLEIFIEIVSQLLASCSSVNDHYMELSTLTRVCSNWRAIIIGTPKLWTTIFLHIPMGTWQDSTLAYAKMYIRRARDLPLQLIVHPGGPLYSYIPTTDVSAEICSLKQVMRVLVIPHMSRWQTITIRTRFSNSLRAGLNELESSVDALEILNASCGLHIFDIPVVHPHCMYSMFSPSFVAPKLRKLELCPTNEFVAKPGPILRSVQRHFPMMEELLVAATDGKWAAHSLMPIDITFIQGLRSLRILRLKLCEIRHTLSNSIDLPNLTELSFEHVSPLGVSYFLQNCTAPLLNQLQVSTMRIFPAVAPLLGDTPLGFRFPLLYSLTLWDVEIIMNQKFGVLEEALGNLDFCQDMRVKSRSGAVSFIESLSEPHGDRWDCRNLRSLTVASAERVRDTKSLRTLVKARNGETARGGGSAHGRQNAPVALSELHVCAGLEVFAEEEKWFKRHLPVFTYSRKGSFTALRSRFEDTECWYQ